MSIINEIYYSIESILTEGVSDIVYHFTYISKLLNILKENKFHASTNVGSAADAGGTSKEKPYFFSTQRSGHKKTGWAKGSASNVSIVLDGRKLNQHYKGFPINYWGWSTDRKDWNTQSGYMTALQSNELEDRIVLDEPTIDNATDYIKEIHIFVDPKDEYSTHPDIIKELRRYNAQYKNIPFYFYNENEDFANQNKAKAVNAKELQSNPNAEELYQSKYDGSTALFRSILPLLAYNDKKNKGMVFDYLKSVLKDKDEKDIEDSLNKKTENLKHTLIVYPHDVINTLGADIHNNRSNPSENSRTVIKMLIDDMKKLNAASLKDYVDIKAGNKEPSTKEKQPKQVTILWDNQLDDHLSWSKSIWSYIETEDFWWETLSSNHRGDLKMVGMINDDSLTFKKFVRQVMPIVGKEKLKKLFTRNEISFKNVASDDNEYDFYTQDWKKS